jgi:hypothetical protein
MVCRYVVPMSLSFYGLRDTTPAYAIIFMNLVPLFSFTLSLVFRYLLSLSMSVFRINFRFNLPCPISVNQ